MNIKIYADGSDRNEMIKIASKVSGFTTNPTLMRKAGIIDYKKFAIDILKHITDLPISFEVFSDDLLEMERQANVLAELGDNVYVKIPITNTQGLCTSWLIKRLLDNKIKVNVTAVFTQEQVSTILPFMDSTTNAIISIFAGRIADTGVNPNNIITNAIDMATTNVEILWASCREVYNIYEADSIGCHIITVPNDIISKLSLRGKNLNDYSMETIKMFYDDAKSCGFVL